MLELSSIIANVTASLSLPLAIIILFIDRRNAQRQRERETYLVMQGYYQDFLSLCTEHSDLSIYGPAADFHSSASKEMDSRKILIFEQLTGMLESAHFLYAQGHSTAFRRKQWDGWRDFASYWMSRPDYAKAWSEYLGSQYDRQFVAFMNNLAASRPLSNHHPVPPHECFCAISSLGV